MLLFTEQCHAYLSEAQRQNWLEVRRQARGIGVELHYRPGINALYALSNPDSVLQPDAQGNTDILIVRAGLFVVTRSFRSPDDLIAHTNRLVRKVQEDIAEHYSRRKHAPSTVDMLRRVWRELQEEES